LRLVYTSSTAAIHTQKSHVGLGLYTSYKAQVKCLQKSKGLIKKLHCRQ